MVIRFHGAPLNERGPKAGLMGIRHRRAQPHKAYEIITIQISSGKQTRSQAFSAARRRFTSSWCD